MNANESYFTNTNKNIFSTIKDPDKIFSAISVILNIRKHGTRDF